MPIRSRFICENIGMLPLAPATGNGLDWLDWADWFEGGIILEELNAEVVAIAAVIVGLVLACAKAYTLPSIEPTYTVLPETAGEDVTWSPVV
jgi:hypothetical protein